MAVCSASSCPGMQTDKLRNISVFGSSRKSSLRTPRHVASAASLPSDARLLQDDAQSPSSSIREAEAFETPLNNGAAEGMEEYAALKKQLLARAKRAVGFLGLYITLQQGMVAGACTIAGGATGFAYLTRVIAEADSIQPSTIVPIMAVLDMDSGPLRQISLLLAAYRQAFRPRWLLPIGLAAAVQAFNHTQDFQISALQEFDMLLGFLCFKAGLFLALYDDIKPKPVETSELDKPARPTLREAAVLNEEEERAEALLRSRKRH